MGRKILNLATAEDQWNNLVPLKWSNVACPRLFSRLWGLRCAEKSCSTSEGCGI